MNTPDEMIRVCEAIRDKKPIQARFHASSEWENINPDLTITPNFYNYEYRVKPKEDISVNLSINSDGHAFYRNGTRMNNLKVVFFGDKPDKIRRVEILD